MWMRPQDVVYLGFYASFDLHLGPPLLSYPQAIPFLSSIFLFLTIQAFENKR